MSTQLTLTPEGINSIKLDWVYDNPTIGGGTNIERSDDGGATWTPIPTVIPNGETTFTDNGATGSTLNSYRIKKEEWTGFAKKESSYPVTVFQNFNYVYSLRKATTKDTPIIRVRRSSDDAETDVYVNGLYSFIDLNSSVEAGGTLGSWVGANDAFVRTWYNQGIGTFNAENTTAAQQPQLISSGSLITVNSLPALSFGNPRQLNFVSGDINGDYSQFAIVESRNLADVGKYLTSLTDSTGQLLNYVSGGTDWAVFDGVNNVLLGTAVVDVQTFTEIIAKGSSSIVGINSLTSTATMQTISGWTNGIIGQRSAATQFFDGYIQELAFADGDKESILNSIETEINLFYPNIGT